MQYEGHRLRHEHKYYIDLNTYHVLRQRLRAVITPDPHMPSEEGYLISSLYFDDMHSSAAVDKVGGARFRKKFRIRIYERSDRVIKLECKIKFDEFISKDSASLTREEYDRILRGDYDFLLSRPEPVCRELFLYNRIHRLKPVVVVEYQREAFIHPLGNVRITFDKDIAASHGDLDMFSPLCTTSKILPDSLMVLEVKYDDFLPVHIQALLHGIPSEHCAISKYVMCRDQKRMVFSR